MSRHLTDHRSESTSGRMIQFLRIDHGQSEAVWHPLWRSTPDASDSRRTVEFLRIARRPEE
jgi:hypothetical protein